MFLRVCMTFQSCLTLGQVCVGAEPTSPSVSGDEGRASLEGQWDEFREATGQRGRHTLRAPQLPLFLGTEHALSAAQLSFIILFSR